MPENKGSSSEELDSSIQTCFEWMDGILQIFEISQILRPFVNYLHILLLE